MDFSHKRYSNVSPLASRLFEIDGINRVFYGKDFITITKETSSEWQHIKPFVFEVITNFYAKG